MMGEGERDVYITVVVLLPWPPEMTDDLRKGLRY